ncbi:MAG: aspartate carbamoyltransferase [Methylococcus sp.]
MKTCILLALIASLPIAVRSAEPASEQRLDEVEQRGAQVMPFSLGQTTHYFTKTATGGVQQVLVKDAADTPQIQLIREHLRKIAGEFQRGDFADPTQIHGDAMPGLADLKKAGPVQLRVDYKELPEGAEIDYATDDPRLVHALHQWFDAQLSDHARHAMPSHSQHSQHQMQ